MTRSRKAKSPARPGGSARLGAPARPGASTRPGQTSAKARVFTPVAARARHDGWTLERQTDFIDALAECACVDAACKRVGKAPSSAYALRRRVDAQSFRIAWDAALDHGVRRLGDAAFSRALNGVARPVFYKGEQIGERRYFDERLTQFMLRHRDPTRFGRWRDGIEFRQQHADGPAILLARATDNVADDADAREAGVPLPPRRPHPQPRYTSAEELADEDAERQEEAARARSLIVQAANDAAEDEAYWRARKAESACHDEAQTDEEKVAESDSKGDVASTSSTSNRVNPDDDEEEEDAPTEWQATVPYGFRR